MTDLSNQRRMAADILKVGMDRVWMDPENSDDIAASITRDDVRAMIEDGLIKRKPKKGISRGRIRAMKRKKAYGHRKGHGSRKGARYARLPKKERWMRKIRALRRRLCELRDEGAIDKTTYRMLYNKARGGEFQDTAHLDTYIGSHGLLNKERS